MGAVLSASSPRTFWDVIPPVAVIGTTLFPQEVFTSITKILPSVEMRRYLRVIPQEGELKEEDEAAPSAEPVKVKSYIGRHASTVHTHDAKGA